MKREFPFEFVYQVFSLLIAVILVHGVYVTIVRPRATTALEEQTLRMQQDPSYVPPRSVYVVIRDLEQEVCFILMLWALAIMAYKAREAWREQGLLERDMVPLPEGVKILPEDTRDYARQLEALPDDVRSLLLPRCLLASLHHFASTRNIHDVAATARSLCESEGERLESELSMIRYITWAIPSIGFIGTVRGIGQALGLAHKAMEGDISGVTQSLGVAFNSTFVALMLSLILMFLVHQLQLMQERLVLNTEVYCDQRLIRNMALPDSGKPT